jgi:hypothetical protein
MSMLFEPPVALLSEVIPLAVLAMPVADYWFAEQRAASKSLAIG